MALREDIGSLGDAFWSAVEQARCRAAGSRQAQARSYFLWASFLELMLIMQLVRIGRVRAFLCRSSFGKVGGARLAVLGKAADEKETC